MDKMTTSQTASPGILESFRSGQVSLFTAPSTSIPTLAAPTQAMSPPHEALWLPGTIASIALGAILVGLLILCLTVSTCWRGSKATALNKDRWDLRHVKQASDSALHEETIQMQDFTELVTAVDENRSAEDPLVSISSACGSLTKGVTDWHPPKKWPRTAKQPTESTSTLAIDIGTDIVLFLLSACFLVFALSAVAYHRKLVEQHGVAVDRLWKAARVGPSIFPILFAAVFGRFLKALATWRLERGVELGFLDLLAGSTSAANTILSQIQLGIPSILGLFLIIAWAFSPLGGQATLRVLGLEDATVTTLVDLEYMTSNTDFSGWKGADLGVAKALLFGLFNAAFLGSVNVKTSPTDTWNNVKIPMIEHILPKHASLLDGEWLDVPDTSDLVYSSLVGIPLSTLPSDSQSRLFLEQAYLVLDCPILKDTDRAGDLLDPNGENFPERNNTEIDYNSLNIYTNVTKAPTDLCHRGDTQNMTMGPRFGSYYSYNPDRTMFGALCSFQTTYVEVEVSCSGQDCRSSRIRNSTLANPVRTWTLFDGHNETNCNWWQFYMQLFFSSLPISRPRTFSPLDGYLVDAGLPVTPIIPDAFTQHKVSNLDREILATRFAQLLNSFMLLCAGVYDVPFGLKPENGGSCYAAANVSTTAQSVRRFQIIACHPAWVAVLLVASALLLVACTMSIVLRTRRRAPELALNWTTVIRDNPHVPASDTACFLDDNERSKLLRHTRLIFGDVAPDRDIGHLAIGSIDRGSGISGVRKERKYY